ncbi:MAG: hypothetical protein HN778_09425 [Prolixibacteraceae bacterium]|jgi:hypothetical protein|nr:hypothetical protein [Prolixibacteraceae bacterium]MBT6007059.1 hypothetical protein [Prolixibacteraceae bacterium]MBT6763377.1 hypothetical protein [Prolixibacteraceae bacterium]MBT6999684.1 hypothetical protein [Prolixibacteraceae bacterium]MBT7395038.1 hypothetical protein [Prolixibacteraceae bacterium]
MFEQIETDEDYRKALKRFLDICKAPRNVNEEIELNLLVILMEKYERENCSYN